MKKPIGLTLLAASCLLISTVVYAQESKECATRQEKPGTAGINRGEKLFEQLNLTAEQKEKLRTNRQTQREEMRSVTNQLKESHKKLQEALKNPAATRESVQSIVTEINALQAKQTELRLNGIFFVKSILTPEQYAQFQKLMEEKTGKMRKHRSWGKERGKSRNQSKETGEKL